MGDAWHIVSMAPEAVKFLPLPVSVLSPWFGLRAKSALPTTPLQTQALCSPFYSQDLDSDLFLTSEHLHHLQPLCLPPRLNTELAHACFFFFFFF